eukprot:CAMPEP_0177525462 /NCGR_PEP_ID=MMETSP0369-20130122/50557_1 /TAXON_ID=447022 ORGANISM="Scrippsiella hangoei-like, Strain SHHI-4" /NCGR_SAMPLE_ID=MMETSP0369 /ASSEMBLY_ACC=CAM_ASM_000364 /LENGTH=223 /DNA_ID=CAMNT_0019005609 /DNA_START=517 /DNA_END=1189 /DNA_ORIENTATION=+
MINDGPLRQYTPGSQFNLNAKQAAMMPMMGIDVVAREGARWDGAQHAAVVEHVDPHVRRCHEQEEPPRVATREVEDHDAQDHVQEEISVSAHLHRAHGRPLRCNLALHLRVSANKETPEKPRSDDRGEGLDQEGDQVRRWEGIPVRVLGQGPLHAVSLELRSELRDFLQGHTEVRAEAQALHDLLGREVCRDEVQPNVEHARDGVQDHVAGLALVLEAEADAV